MPPSGALPRLELTCFGPPTALLDGRTPPPEVLWPKHLALLIYLALSPDRRRTRDHLLGLLWPEKPNAHARHALNETLRRLRAALGADRLVSVADAVALSEEHLQTDALQFADLADRDPTAAAALLKGDFLEGFSVSDAPRFEEWTHQERQRFQARGANVLVAVGEEKLASCGFSAAADLGQRALALQSYSEPAAHLLMRAAALNGDAGTALAMFRRFSERLEHEIGEKPGRELRDLANRIRQRIDKATPPPQDRDPPLIGREGVHARVFAQVERGLREGPSVVVISGDPGMGRTRLLAECTERLILDGALVAAARPLYSDHDAPWSTLRALLRTDLHRAPGLKAAAPDALAVLAWLVPELQEHTRPREPRDAADAAHALAEVLGALADEQPIALAIDDAHLADGATLGVLGAALSHLPAAPLMVLLTALERSEHQPRDLLELRGQVGRTLRGIGVRLDPLTAGEMAELVASVATWCADERDRDRLARRLMFESGGGPFVAVTLLYRLEQAATLRKDLMAWPPEHQTYDARLPFSIPALLNLSVAARVTALDEQDRRVLCAATIGPQALDVDLITRLVERPDSELDASLSSLERHRFLTYDGERYAFPARILADIVRNECLTRGERQALRRRAAAALASRTDLDSRALHAELLALVEPGSNAFQTAATVARDAHAAGSARTARRALAAAERAALSDAAARSAVEQLREEILSPNLRGP